MKKSIFAISRLFLAFGLFTGCSNGSDSSTLFIPVTNSTSNSTTKNNTTTEETIKEFTLTFDGNYPFDTSTRYVNNKIVYASEWTENGFTYFFDKTYYNEQESKKGTAITLEKSPYGYSKYKKESNTIFAIVQEFEFNHYNTSKDDSGTSYRTGDSITLIKDTTLYCFYSDKAASTGGSNGTAIDFNEGLTYDMKVGETLTFNNMINGQEYYFESNDSSVIECNDTNKTIKALSAGTVPVIAKSTSSGATLANCVINVTYGNTSGTSINTLLVGTWETSGTYSGSSYSGTITFNNDSTGNINYTVQNNTYSINFNWSSTESSGNKYLTISGTNLLSTGTKSITLSGNTLIIKEYIALGLPQNSNWSKQ